MNESKYILTIHLNRIEPITKGENPIEQLLINQEDVELHIAGFGDELWITNKRMIVYHIEKDQGFLFDSEIHQYTSFLFSKVFSISVDYLHGDNNRIFITFDNDTQFHIMIDKVSPITEVAQVLTEKMMV